MKTLEEITKEIEALQERATNALDTAEKDSSKTAEVKALVDDEIKPQLDVLTKDREQVLKENEFSETREQVISLKKTIEELRKPSDGFVIAPAKAEGKAIDSDSPYADGEHSPFTDVFLASKGSNDARERLSYNNKRYEGFQTTEEGKVLTGMTEGTPSQGGYLVQPELERQLLLAREADNVIRPLASSITVNTNAIQLDQLGIKTAAAWTAELATKFEETAMTIKTVTASVFTAAGLATISNQLLADSNPAIDQLVTTDLAKRLVALEEIAFLTGSGEGQPLGILNTPEVGTTANTSATLDDPAKAGGLLDKILEAIANVQLEWGQPSAIVMHPRTWTRIIKSRDTAGHYTISPRNNVGAGYDPATPRTFVNGPEQTLFGVPVVLSNRIPTNLGAGTNESRVIVGDFKEALILDRQGITIDESPHVYFTANATVFRAECRVGFTAGRSPKAFNVIGGTGLAAG